MPSLVNLSHVCSHLQNASLARLGLTSIPYTRLHLSLALLLQKQGFLSQVKLAGPSPPPSCFPPGVRDNIGVASHAQNREDGGAWSGEAALQRMVGQGATTEALREMGFGEEAVEFAMEKREKTQVQLERDGWDEVAASFLVRFEGRSREEMEQAGVDEEGIAIVEQHRSMLEECRAEATRHHPSSQAFESERAYHSFLQNSLRHHLLRQGFSHPTLRYVAGPQHTLISSRNLARDGLEVEAMGLTIPNQPFVPPPPPHPSSPVDPDPWQLETEGIVTQANRASRRLWLGLKYWDGHPVLSKARMISKPSKRIFLDYRELGRVVRGNAAGEVKPLTKVGEVMAVLTKGRGVVEARECVERKMDGMVLCRVW